MSGYKPEYSGNVIVPQMSIKGFSSDLMRGIGMSLGYELVRYSGKNDCWILRPSDGDADGLIKKLEGIELKIPQSTGNLEKLFPACWKEDLKYKRRSSQLKGFIGELENNYDLLDQTPKTEYNQELERLSELLLSLREPKQD